LLFFVLNYNNMNVNDKNMTKKVHNNNIEQYFPFDTFRPYQKEILNKIVKDFENGTKVVILDGPVGFGKSPVNIALGDYFKPSFYTTPQVKLVNQLSKDFCPKKLAIDGGYGDCIAFLGRRNYRCRETGLDSDICPYRTGVQVEDDFGRIKKKTCSKMENCTYQKQKEAASESNIAILTFAMLIINSYLNYFPKRNLLIIDECHNLENQVANLFAGFTISFKILPKSFGEELREKIWKEDIEEYLPNSRQIEDYLPFFMKFKELTTKWRPLCQNERDLDKLRNLSRRIKNILEEIEEGRIWTVNLTYYGEYNSRIPRLFSPILIDKFLQEKLWRQANKIILSSATIPYRNNVVKWLERIGLNDKAFKFHSVPMTFPIENRKIITAYMNGKMTYNEEKKNWNANINSIKSIIKKHGSEKGVIHTQSYSRAKKLYDDLKGYNLFLHKEKVSESIIDQWVNSKKQILVSPSIKDGVDLKDDLCRFQILLKIPYPNIKNARVDYLLNKKKDWVWYNEETTRDIIQMYGRAIRSSTDYATFYIIDSSFNNLPKRNFPDWFLKALPENRIKNNE